MRKTEKLTGSTNSNEKTATATHTDKVEDFAQRVFNTLDGRYDSKIVHENSDQTEMVWQTFRSNWHEDPREAEQDVVQVFNAYASGKGGTLFWKTLPSLLCRGVDGKYQIAFHASIADKTEAALQVKEEVDEHIQSLKDQSMPSHRIRKHRQCRTCDFWDRKATDHIAALCRKSPPQFWPDTPSQKWAITHENDWCGSYEERKS